MTATLSPVTAQDQDRRGARTSAYAMFFGTWQIGRYYWLAVFIITGVVAAIIHAWGELDGSVAEGILGSAPIFLSVLGLIIPLGLLPLHLAGGVTRRSFARGLMTAAVGLGVSFALVGAIGMLVESIVFGALDWSTAVDAPGLYDSSGDFFTIWLSWSLSCTAYALAGGAIGLGYYRWGAVWGTVQMVVAVALVIVGELALGGGLYLSDLSDLVGDGVPAVVAVLVSLATSAALAVMVQRTLRDVALRPSAISGCR